MKTIYAWLIAGIIIVIELTKVIINLIISACFKWAERRKKEKEND